MIQKRHKLINWFSWNKYRWDGELNYCKFDEYFNLWLGIQGSNLPDVIKDKLLKIVNEKYKLTPHQKSPVKIKIAKEIYIKNLFQTKK